MKFTSAIRSLCCLSFITVSATYEYTYSFPPTNTTEFAHGLCVLGASSASAFSTIDPLGSPNLYYTAVSDFKNGVILWDDRPYAANGVEGDEMCKGGIYLKPSKARAIDRNTNITLKAISIDGNNISIYAFLIDTPIFTGDWAEFLRSDGFEVSDSFPFATMTDDGYGFEGNWRSYYKTLINVQLPAKLYLPAPNCTTSDSAIGVVTCRFTEIICTGNVTQSVKILDYECDTDYNSTTYGNTSVVESSTPSTCDSDVSEFDAMAEVNYKSGHEGDVNFCIRTELIEGGEIMYYRSERVKMTFEYDGEFLVTSFNTSEYEGISKDATVATKSFGVEAEICNESGDKSTGSSALAIGDNLFVCIKTKDEGTRITAITNFTAEKATDTSTDTENLVIDGSKSNVVVTGLGSEKLMVVINFPARFFTNTNVIVLKGNVEVKGTKSRRLLSPRALQEVTPEVTSDDATFGLVIGVVADLSSATGHNMMIAALLGVPALLLV